jgi:hypothetical protein
LESRVGDTATLKRAATDSLLAVFLALRDSGIRATMEIADEQSHLLQFSRGDEVVCMRFQMRRAEQATSSDAPPPTPMMQLTTTIGQSLSTVDYATYDDGKYVTKLLIDACDLSKLVGVVCAILIFLLTNLKICSFWRNANRRGAKRIYKFK